jgi:hypothetical protein
MVSEVEKRVKVLIGKKFVWFFIPYGTPCSTAREYGDPLWYTPAPMNLLFNSEHKSAA